MIPSLDHIAHLERLRLRGVFKVDNSRLINGLGELSDIEWHDGRTLEDDVGRAWEGNTSDTVGIGL